MALKEYKPGAAFNGVIGRTFDVFVRRLDKRRDRGVDAAVVDGFHEDVARIRVALTG